MVDEASKLKPDEILIDEENQKILLERVRAFKEIQTQIGLICEVIRNASGKEGQYQLSEDCTKLVEQINRPMPTMSHHQEEIDE